MAKIKYYEELYDYLKKDKKHFDFVKTPSIPSIEVTRIDEKGKPIIIINPGPPPREQIARYIFTGVEVSGPKKTIGEIAMRAIIENLLLPSDIFEHPPFEYKHPNIK